MVNILNKWLFLVGVALSLVFAQSLFAKEVYRCEVNGSTTYQATPCKNKATQKVACLNYAMSSDFKDSLGDNQCFDNGANDGGYGGYSSGYSGSSSSSYSSGSSRSSYSSGRAKNQRVSGYTRKDGTYVKSYMRSRK
jgi:hypothetical protein